MHCAVGLLLLAGCAPNSNCLEIADLGDLSPVGEQLSIHFDQLDATQSIFQKGNYAFWEDADSKRTFVLGEGVLADGAKVIFRSECFVNAGEGGISLMEMSSEMERCLGRNCAACTFAPEGGCACQKVEDSTAGEGICEHGISKMK